MNQEYLDRIYSLVDYKVGDWVETCNMLPGIVEEINYENDNVKVFYPHYAIKDPGYYCGGSNCSILHCGVHKISLEYAKKLFSIGEERLAELYNVMGPTSETWEDVVEKEYNKMYNK